jgi:hypothetical protein
MTDDLLKALGRAARDERAAADATSSEAPVLDEVTRERVVQRALDELGAKGADAPPAKAAPPAKVAARNPRRAAIGAAILLAASLALAVGLRRSALPPFALSVQGGTSEWRGDERAVADRVVVRSDGMIELLVRPERPIDRPIEARAFATRGGVAKVLPVEISPRGVVRVAGKATDLFGPVSAASPDEWRVIIVVGERGDVPTSVAEVRARDDLRISEIVVVVNTS